MRGVRKKRRRRRGEKEWLRFHYILYMSKMPGRLLPASLSAPCWMCVCTCTHSSVVFTLSLTFSCRKKKKTTCQDFGFLKWIYPTGSLGAAPTSHSFTERRGDAKRSKKKRRRRKALQHVCRTSTVIYTQPCFQVMQHSWQWILMNWIHLNWGEASEWCS